MSYEEEDTCVIGGGGYMRLSITLNFRAASASVKERCSTIVL